ncbi:phosphotransferase family protein [Natronomonas sp.]|uniref:phosphotransferase family protein n=1 Tax=Natronomonas sp. TaxID=2184060 RepID=UPI0039755694
MTDPWPATPADAGPLRAAADAALAAIDAPPMEIEPLRRGNRKQTAIARFEERGPVVVQVCPERTWLRTEAALLGELRRRTFVPVPPVLAAGTHEGVAYTLTAYVPGDDLHERFVTLETDTQRDLVRWFGRALARLHDTFGFDGYGPLMLSEGRFTAAHADWGVWFREYAQQAIDRLPSAFDSIRDELTASIASAPNTAPEARLFPWDFRPGNALVADGSVTAVLDWEAPLAGAPALSVAKSEYLVADWYVDDPALLRRAFRDGYATVRAYPSIAPAYRVAAIAESAIDSSGTVTNLRHPPVGRDESVAFHRDALVSVLE